MRVLLAYPPDSLLPSAPYSSLAALTPCLERAGHEVRARDLNVEVFRKVMQPEILAATHEGLREQVDELLGRSSLGADGEAELDRLQRLLAVPRGLFDEVPDALAALKDKERFYDPDEFNRAFDVVRASLRFAHNAGSACFATHRKTRYEDPDWLHTSGDAVLDVFRGGLVDSLLAEEPDIIGLSMAFDPGIHYGLALAAMIREQAPDIPIIIGGAAVDSHNFPLKTSPALFRFYDYVMSGDGDHSFPEFLAALQKGTDPAEIDNLTYRAPNGEVKTTATNIVRNLNDLPSPDLRQLPLDDYLLPEPIATFQTSRGCYYFNCTFCSELFRKNYRLRKPDLVLQDMISIHETTGISNFQFWDSLTPPKTLYHLAEQIKARELPFTWMAETKFETTYAQPGFVQTLRDGGGLFLQFGFESGTNRVLELMDKGNDMETVEVIINEMGKAGMRAGVTWFIGFPTETEAEADQSFDFISRHRDVILLSSYTGTFDLGEDTFIWDDPERFGIEIIDREGGHDFRYLDGTGRRDLSEQNETFTARGDLNLLQNHTELLWSRVPMETAKRISAQHRLGRTLDEIAAPEREEVTFERTPECHIGEQPGRAGPRTLCWQIMTGHVYELSDEHKALLDTLAKPTTLLALAEHFDCEPETLLPTLELAVRRGLVRVHTPAGKSAAARQPEVAAAKPS